MDLAEIVHCCTICKEIIQDMPDGHNFTHASAYQLIAMTRREANGMTTKHAVNGDQQGGWYCYQCKFTTWDVEAAAAHDGMRAIDGPMAERREKQNDNASLSNE